MYRRGRVPVVLQIIDSPGSPRARILFFMAVAGLETGASLAARSGINADLEAFRMHIISKRFHVRELLVGLYVSILVALGLPGVVDVDIDVTGIAHAAGCHCVGDLAHGFVVDSSSEFVPTVPTHGRCFGESVGWDGFKWRKGFVRARQ